MKLKKYGGKVYGAQLSKNEQKAMDIEIENQIAEYDRKHLDEVAACVLWTLHETNGFGPKRLKEFYDIFIANYIVMINGYGLGKSNNLWDYTNKLSDYGFDISRIREEKIELQKEKHWRV